MRIEIESQMRQAARDRLTAYQPIFRGQPLAVENKSPEVSLANLRVLLGAGLQLSAIAVIENRGVLITFSTGETYLATGFSVGTYEPTTKLFATFCLEAVGGQLEDWETYLSEIHGPDHEGEIDIRSAPNTADLAQPQIFCGND